MSERFKNSLQAFDNVNAQDPHKELSEGNEIPKELLYSQRMSAMLNDFAPDASEALALAARAQHIQRWAIPREEFPMDRKGYLLWRNKLKKYHGELAASIMKENGYDEETAEKVEDLLNKRKLKVDGDSQTLEDVVCLVFLKYYFEDFIPNHEEPKLIDIVRKTWNKMSEKGRKAALALELPPKSAAVVREALG